MKLSTKIIATSLLGALACLMVGLLSVISLSYSAKSLSDLNLEARNNLAAVDAARSAQVAFKTQVQEWKNILLRGRDPAAFAKHREGFEKEGKLTAEHLSQLKAMVVGDASLAGAVDEGLRTHAELLAKYDTALKLYSPTNSESAQIVDKAVKGIDRPPTEAIDRLVSTLIKKAGTESKASEMRFDKMSARMRWASYGGVAAAFLLAIGAGYRVSLSISRPIARVTQSLAESAGQTKTAAAQIATSSQQVAEGASQQAAALEQTGASLEEISSTVRTTAEGARSAKDLSNQTRHAAENGASEMTAMISAMEAIQESSGGIAKIIKAIDEIAFQTNILALNAAVEAARAGAVGTGFAVVADEVRNLAQRSASAAQETAAQIEDSIRKSAHGFDISNKIASHLREIVSKARAVDDLVAGIATASTEQGHGIGQVNKATGEMDRVTQLNAASAEECASAAEELNAQAGSMLERVMDLRKLVEGQRAAVHS